MMLGSEELLQCSVRSKPGVVVTVFRLDEAIIYGFTKWWLLEAYFQRNLRTRIQQSK